MSMRTLVSLLLLLVIATSVVAQPMGSWHNKERQLRYTPEGDDFVIVNGDWKFNRALYGTNTAFRIETGDVPEFGLFMPHMGGNIQLGMLSGGKSLWLNDAEYVKSIYRPGSRIYEIKDPLLGAGSLTITALALADAEGLILRVEANGLSDGGTLVTLFGGASNRRFSRNGDLGVDDPEAFALKADACEGNQFAIHDESFRLTYGEGTRGGPLYTIGLFSEGTTLKLGSPYSLNTVSALTRSEVSDNRPLLVAQSSVNGDEVYLVIKADDGEALTQEMLSYLFEEAEQKRSCIAGTVKINTPDPFFNTLGGALSIAADGIWDEESAVWQHGAIGWRMPLNGWRAAYTGDAIGWHDRARRHFNGYAASPLGPITVPEENLILSKVPEKGIYGTGHNSVVQVPAAPMVLRWEMLQASTGRYVSTEWSSATMVALNRCSPLFNPRHCRLIDSTSCSNRIGLRTFQHELFILSEKLYCNENEKSFIRCCIVTFCCFFFWPGRFWCGREDQRRLEIYA